MLYHTYTVPATVDGQSLILAIETKGDVMEAIRFASEIEKDPTISNDYQNGSFVVGGYLNYRSIPNCEMNKEENMA